MTETMTFTAADVVPDRETVWRYQGIPDGTAVPERIERLFTAALGMFAQAATPKGILSEITKSEFEAVYQGEGRNEPETPVGDIFPRAEGLALFAVTLGQQICTEIDSYFKANDPALACMMDSLASVVADQLTEVVERRFHALLPKDGKAGRGSCVLGYSPGYCGWHVSGQRKLLEYLRPGRIGISLRESFLMEPLKSVSGVMIAGPRELHSFPSSYPCCSRCETRSCHERVRALPSE